MDKSIELISLYNQINESVKTLQSELSNLQSHVYKIGQINTHLRKPEILEQGSIDLAITALAHFKLEAGEIVKHVNRYPGVVTVQSDHQFESLIRLIETVNQTKQTISDFLKMNGKAGYIFDDAGQKIYAANDLLFKSLPMVNQLMLTRKIDYIEQPVKQFSYSWNIDFNHQFIKDISEYLSKLGNRTLTTLPFGFTRESWLQHLASVKHKIDIELDKGHSIKVIRPKPIEPVLYVTFYDGSPITIKPKLPVLVKTKQPIEAVIRQKLPSPPNHSEKMTNGRKYTYLQLCSYTHIYSCTKIK
ncbi:hypothetical protein C2869_22000 (plasmid) [Saccharobesus litoralis]|uniref:Uncharacterized protein n=1 Tax=Saccharobesus litoralis TaxID=2172099 RepID=A0A2S0VYA9_9ALTE|nr:DNA replication terminus site-binding protein [Saccharobesus litoralis]AWB69178.1 hypothetical protein C2869_22000 [Saccharobesus litoralis]